MKKLAFPAVLALAIGLGSCASSTNTPAPTTGAGGIWEAQLYGGTGEAALLDFTSQFSVGSGSTTLDITSFAFINTNPNSCFLTVSGESGSAVLTTSASNRVTGTLSYTVSSASPSGNVLALTAAPSTNLPGSGVTGMSTNGALTDGVVIGTWTLDGGFSSNNPCSGSGTFVMCQEAVPNGDGGCGTAN